MTETSAPVDILDGLNAGDGEVAKWILPLIFPDLNARTLQEKGNEHLLQDNVARLAGNLQTVASNVTAYSEALQTQWRAIAVLAKNQGQATNNVRELRALIESVAAGVTDVAREQAAVRGAVQDSTKVLGATTEAIQQGQKTLQAEVEKITDAARQTIAGLTATAAEQTAVHETVQRVKEEVTGLAGKQTALSEAVQAHAQASAATAATLTGRQDQLAGDVRRLHELTQTVAGSVGDVTREQAAVRGAMQESARVVSATTEAIQQGQRTLQTEVEKITEAAKQTTAAVTATAAEQTAVHETVRHVMEEVAGVGAKQTTLSEAVQAQAQASAAATATLAAGHDQLAGDVRRLHEVTQTVAGGLADVLREQAAVRSTVQDGTKVLGTTTEAIQQGQRTLQTEMEKMVETTTRQITAALTTTAGEQAAVHEMVKHVGEEVTGVGAKQNALHEAVAALTAKAADQTVVPETVRRVMEEVTAMGTRQTALHEAVAALTAKAAEQTAVPETVRRVMEEVAGVGNRQTALHEAVVALTTKAAEQTAVPETVRRVMEEVTGVGARQTALHEAVQAHGQALNGAAATLAGGHEQLAGDVRRLHDLTQTVAGSVADVAREQVAVRGAMQDGAKILSATIETIQQGLRTLQTEVEKMVETTRQTIAALTATVTEQSTGQEMTKRMIGELANAAMAALAAGHAQLPDDVPPIQAPVQTTDNVGSPEVRPPVPAAEGGSPQTLHAAKAITHGEQIRYELGSDRDNLGCWTNASDWAEWEFEITRPGQYKVTAQIAAVASGRFQVVLGDQKLEGSAPNTGDYGRFQQVELGTVTLTSSGKTSVAVRPIPEGWQPMNLKSLDLVPLAEAVPCGA